MEYSKHRALLVEDHPDTLQELEEILQALGFEVSACDNKQTALEHVAKQTFCIAVLDLQIFGEPGANKGHVEHGRSLLREIRRIYPHRNGTEHSFPILVVSGYAREGMEAKEVMKDGASDIVWKLATGGLSSELSRIIREQLRASGREDHASCATAPGPTVAPSTDFELSISGVRVGQRTEVALGSRSTHVTDRSLWVLLCLVVGRLKGNHVHNSEMSRSNTGTFKAISRLKHEMKGVFPPGMESIARNHYHGNYSLDDAVTIGSIAYDELVALEDTPITELVREIRKLREESDGNS